MMYCTFVARGPKEVLVTQHTSHGTVLIKVIDAGEGLWLVLPETVALDVAQKIRALKYKEDPDVRAA